MCYIGIIGWLRDGARSTSCKCSSIEKLMIHNSLGGPGDDEILRVWRVTSRADKETHLLQWWKGNSESFPYISDPAFRVLAVQASFIASKSVFSVSETLIGTECCPLSDGSIRPCMCVQAWDRNIGGK